MIEMSNKIAAYLYCPEGKNYDYEQMLSMLRMKSGNIEIHEVYSDGWDDIPNNLEEMMLDLPNYTHIVLLTLEGITVEQLKQIVTRCAVFCPLVETEWATNAKSDAFKALVTTIHAREYYKQIRSLNIRSGMKNTDKHIGNLPFGHRRLDDGTIQPISSEMELANSIKEMYQAGYPVTEISFKTNGKLTTRQVYALMNYWGVTRG